MQKQLRMISAILLPLILALLSTAVRTASIDTSTGSYTVASGSCGSSINWTLNSAGLLTISGSGAMQEFVSSGTSYTFMGRLYT